MTTYRCPLHPSAPVTWRGTGCALCAREAEQVRQQRREAREREGEDRR